MTHRCGCGNVVMSVCLSTYLVYALTFESLYLETSQVVYHRLKDSPVLSALNIVHFAVLMLMLCGCTIAINEGYV